MFNDLSRLGKYLGQAARLMVGMPDYAITSSTCRASTRTSR
jgi:uncharacterized short protein YbdD (DUF466 family)